LIKASCVVCAVADLPLFDQQVFALIYGPMARTNGPINKDTIMYYWEAPLAPEHRDIDAFELALFDALTQLASLGLIHQQHYEIGFFQEGQRRPSVGGQFARIPAGWRAYQHHQPTPATLK
jgi:hypothetical protein